jgi:lipopolysaccharide export LptBFGC system permease protein LptF
MVASAVLFIVNEYLAGPGNDAAETLLASHQTIKQHKPVNPFQEVDFYNSYDDRIWRLDYNMSTKEMRNVWVKWQKPDGTRLFFYAESGWRANETWVFSNVQSHVFEPTNIMPMNRILTNVMAMPEFTETPAQIRSEIVINLESSKLHVERTQIPLADLLRYIRLHPHLSPKEHGWVYTQLYSRMATPWTCLVVVLIAIPFGAMGGRRNVFFGVAGSIFIFFIYYVLLQVGLALGAAGDLPPLLAAWLPNLFFGVSGLVMTLRVR